MAGVADIKYKDRESALKAVKKDELELYYVSPHLKDNRELGTFVHPTHQPTF